MNRQNRNRTGNQALVREINLAMVMTHLREHAPVSRATLSELTGLNKTTISSLIQELLQYQYVREVGLTANPTGRPAMLLEFNPNGGAIISGEIGVDFIAALCTDFTGNPLWQKRQPTDPGSSQSDILAQAVALLQQAITVGQAQPGPLLGLSLGVPGLVDQQSGDLLFAPNLKWQNVPLRAILREKFNLPIFVNNEANMAALGEHYFGAARHHHDVLYISAGVGLGGGIIREGQLVNGAAGFSGEFGHMTMDPLGRPCNCGNRGCWETQVSQSALFHYIREATENEGRASKLLGMTGGNLTRLTVPLVVQAAQSGDAVALAALQKVGRYLGIGMAGLVNALNPDLIVFGGILSLAGNFLLPTITEQIQQRALPYLWGEQTAQVVLAHHGVDACLMGGVAMCYEYVISNPGKAAGNQKY